MKWIQNNTVAARSVHVAMLVFVLGAALICLRYFPLLSWIRHLEAKAAGWGIAGQMTFPLIYALCNILLLPGGVLGISAGFLYGLIPGFCLVLSGNVLGAAVSFIVGRRLFRGVIKERFLSNPRYEALDQLLAKDGAKIVILTQLNPLFPTSLLNYFYGVSALSFAKTMLWVALGQAPGLFLYAYFGTLGQVSLDALQRDSGKGQFWLCIAGFVVSIAATVYLARLAGRILQECLSPGTSTPKTPSPPEAKTAVPYKGQRAVGWL